MYKMQEALDNIMRTATWGVGEGCVYIRVNLPTGACVGRTVGLAYSWYTGRRGDDFWDFLSVQSAKVRQMAEGLITPLYPN